MISAFQQIAGRQARPPSRSIAFHHVHRAHPAELTTSHVRHRSQGGYILLPVVLALALLASIAWLINREAAIHGGIVANTTETIMAEHVTRAGLAHAGWQTNNGNCMADLTMTTVAFGPDGDHSYTATIDSPATSTTSYTFSPDRDTWVYEKDSTLNMGNDSKLILSNITSESKHVLYHFDLSSIPATSQVASAKLWLHTLNNDPDGAITLHRVIDAWTETGANWDNIGSSYDSQVLGLIAQQPAVNSWIGVNLTALAQSWVNNPGTNHGLILIATSNDVDSTYTSREHSTTSLRPYLELTISDGPVSPVSIKATGILYSGVSRTITRTGVQALQDPGGTSMLQPGSSGQDTYIYDGQPASNLDSETLLSISNKSNTNKRGLLRFDLGTIPVGATVTSAELEMNLLGIGSGVTVSVDVHRMTTAWTANEATWNEARNGVNWDSAGGDYDPAVEATAAIDASSPGPTTWDIKDLVSDWVAGSSQNNGLMLLGSSGVNDADFTTSDADTAALRPKLTLTYQGCECGSTCLTPRGSGNVLIVVADATTLAPVDAYKKTLFKSWGYTVAIIGESESQISYDSAVADADVVYISETVNASEVGTKLAGAPVGVITEDGHYNDDLGISNNAGFTTGSVINITDTSHFITEFFPSGLLEIYDANMEQLVVTSSPAPGLQTLAEISGNSSLGVLEAGATLKDGATAAGRRVMLPLGRVANFNWDHLNRNGRLLVQRAIEWAGAGVSTLPGGVVFEEFTDAKATSVANLSINKPPGTASGELLIATLVTDGSTAGSMSPPAGWNVVDLAEQGGQVTFGVWWKLANASESASYSFSWSGDENVYGTIMRFTGHDPSNPIHVSSNTGGSSSTPTSPAVITTVANTMILRLAGFDDDDISVGNPGLANHTAITMDKSNNGNGTSSAGAGFLTQAAAGDNGTSTFSLTNTEEYRAVTVAIAPAP